jgi:hypothetical protein
MAALPLFAIQWRAVCPVKWSYSIRGAPIRSQLLKIQSIGEAYTENARKMYTVQNKMDA